jgi:hypothetical protein
MTTLKLLNYKFGNDVASIIEQFLLPDYKFNFSHVVRALNWEAGQKAIIMLSRYDKWHFHQIHPDRYYDELMGYVNSFGLDFSMLKISSKYEYGEVMNRLQGRFDLIEFKRYKGHYPVTQFIGAYPNDTDSD